MDYAITMRRQGEWLLSDIAVLTGSGFEITCISVLVYDTKKNTNGHPMFLGPATQ